MLATPWLLPAVNNPPSENTCYMVVQVQTQSSGYPGNQPTLSTNRIEWFSTGNQQLPCSPQPITSTTLLDPDYKIPDNALVTYNGNNPFIPNTNAIIALPPTPPSMPSMLTLSVPSLDIPRSFILQAAGLMDPVAIPQLPIPRPDHTSYVSRIMRTVPAPLQDTCTIVQGSMPVANIMSAMSPNFGQCVRLPTLVPGAAAAANPLPQYGNNLQTTWVSVVAPNKAVAAEDEAKIETESYITELSAVCSSCGIAISDQSSQLTQDEKCSMCIGTNSLPLQCHSADTEVQVEISNEIAIKECSCSCQNGAEWNSVPCENCTNISNLVKPEGYASDASDANCQTISTTTVEAGIQASPEMEPCLESTFDSEHEEFEPTTHAINSIIRQLLEEEIENGKETKSLDVFNIRDDPVRNTSFIDLNTSVDEECDTPTTGVKDVLMTGAPSSCTKRRIGGTHNGTKKVRTVLDPAQRCSTCSKCGNKFSSTLNLRKHYMDHENEKSYECGKCKQTFNGCYSYKRHSWTHDKDAECEDGPVEANIFSESSEEEGIQPYGCAQCGKEFSDCFLLTEHCATHVRSKPFSCTQCEMCFESVVLLERHTKIHVRTKTILFKGYEAESEPSSES